MDDPIEKETVLGVDLESEDGGASARLTSFRVWAMLEEGTNGCLTVPWGIELDGGVVSSIWGKNKVDIL
jgi:hypothetical protein